MNYDNLPYGYKWLIEITLSFLVALTFVGIFYPAPTIQSFGMLHYLKYDDAVFLIADSVKYIVFYNFLGKILSLFEQKFSRRSYGAVIPNIVGGITLLFAFIALRDLFYHAKHLYQAIDNSLLGLKYNLPSIWKMDKGDIIRLVILSVALPLGFSFLPEKIMRQRQRMKENRVFRQMFKEGRGGSAQWASEPTFERLYGIISTRSKKIILGHSLFDDDPNTRIVGIDDDAHIITVGMTGSGKSTTVLLPNLATYGGSAIVLDPKGELANMTFRCRSSEHWLKSLNVQGKTVSHHSNGRCFVLDPFGETKNLPRSSYNLLSEIDIDSDRVRGMLSAISDGCVTPEKGENVHFEELAKNFIEGIIAHVLSWYPKENHHLPFVFDLINGIDADLKAADPTKFNALLYEMMRDDAAGGLPQHIASRIVDMGDREKGSVLSTVARSVKWMSDPAMRKHLSHSDFKLSEMNAAYFNNEGYERTEKTTVYIVLPDGLIKEQMRWLRSLISLSLTLIKNAPIRPQIPTLFIMDEFPRLGGKIDIISEGFGILRGYGIKLWAFLQDIGQLQKDYPDRWTSMLANSTVQVFGVNDMKTAEWVSDMLGEGANTVKDKNNQVHERIRPLLTPNEVMVKFGKTENRQFVKTAEGFPMRLERCAYKPLDIGKHGFYEYYRNALKGCFEDW